MLCLPYAGFFLCIYLTFCQQYLLPAPLYLARLQNWSLGFSSTNFGFTARKFLPTDPSEPEVGLKTNTCLPHTAAALDKHMFYMIWAAAAILSILFFQRKDNPRLRFLKS